MLFFRLPQLLSLLLLPQLLIVADFSFPPSLTTAPFPPMVVACFGLHTLSPLLQTPSFTSVLSLLSHTLVHEHVGNGDFKLSTAEFAYNTSLNKTTDKRSQEIVYGVRSSQPIDHIPKAEHHKAFEFKLHHTCTSYTRESVIRLYIKTLTTSYKLIF